AFAQSYDPHTQYLSPDNAENFDINMSLSLEGIGAVLQSDNDYVKVVRLVPAGPAAKSKQIATSDQIIGVAQGKGEMVDVVGWRLDEVV
ncbi:PDZ domain-containing protein, partial [Acinetobacter baumannii]